MNSELPKVSEIKLPPGVSPEDAEDLRDAIQDLIDGVRDPEKMRRAGERMDRMREEMEPTDIAVQLIREVRGEARGMSSTPASP
jgi:hypothetical protein